MADAEVRYSERGETLVVAVAGEVDMSNADDLRAAIEGRMATPRDLILDLSDVEYIDSAGIHFMFVLRKRLGARGQKVELVVPPGSSTEAVLRYAGALDELGRDAP